MYRKWQGEVFGSSCDDEYDKLGKAVDEANKIGLSQSSLVVDEDGTYRLTMCTGLMSRCHQLDESGGIVFIDGCTDFVAGTKDVFVILLTDSPIGGLPLGCFLTNKGTVDNFSRSLRQLADNMPRKKFAGNLQPRGVMGDDGCELKAAAKVWALSFPLICLFHFLQSGGFSFANQVLSHCLFRGIGFLISFFCCCNHSFLSVGLVIKQRR